MPSVSSRIDSAPPSDAAYELKYICDTSSVACGSARAPRSPAAAAYVPPPPALAPPPVNVPPLPLAPAPP
eukprot:1003-Chlamydomonas_euryale.AAC.10